MNETREILAVNEAFKTERLLLWAVTLEGLHAQQTQAENLNNAMLAARAAGIRMADIRPITGIYGIGFVEYMAQVVQACEAYEAKLRDLESGYALYVGMKLTFFLQEDIDRNDYIPRAEGTFQGIAWTPHGGVVLTFLDVAGEVQGFSVGEGTVVDIPPLQG